MPIPAFTIDGILPPYIGPTGPGGALEDMSPYKASVTEIVSTLGTSPRRQEILKGWIEHRHQLRVLGFDRGFQWLDGSFVEMKDPNDLDVVTFLHRPSAYNSSAGISYLMTNNPQLFRRKPVKQTYDLDAFFIDLGGSPENVVGLTRYLLGLFSHRRGDDVWKGMIETRIEDEQDDLNALMLLV